MISAGSFQLKHFLFSVLLLIFYSILSSILSFLFILLGLSNLRMGRHYYQDQTMCLTFKKPFSISTAILLKQLWGGYLHFPLMLNYSQLFQCLNIDFDIVDEYTDI